MYACAGYLDMHRTCRHRTCQATWSGVAHLVHRAATADAKAMCCLPPCGKGNSIVRDKEDRET